MVKQFEDKASISKLCKWASLPQSVFYYRPQDGKRGVKPSTHTVMKDGRVIPNEKVVEDIKGALDREFCCYGYHNITDDLHDLGYIINHKKVYRLMDENKLLLGKTIRTQGRREFVKHRKIEATRPLECICLDIKYVWVQGECKNYYLLTVLDVFTRKALQQLLKSSIRKMDVIDLFRRIDVEHGIKGVTVRNDNGSQFIANDVKQFLKTAEARQEFTHIATPEENAYIEAFHSIVEREVIQRFEFSSYYDAKKTFEAHCKWYNYTRKHGQLGRITPHQKWEGYFNKKNDNLATPDEAEAGHAGEQPVRNNPANEDDWAGIGKPVPAPL